LACGVSLEVSLPTNFKNIININTIKSQMPIPYNFLITGIGIGLLLAFALAAVICCRAIRRLYGETSCLRPLGSFDLSRDEERAGGESSSAREMPVFFRRGHRGEGDSASIQTNTTLVSGELPPQEDAPLIVFDEDLPGIPEDPVGEWLEDVTEPVFHSSLLDPGDSGTVADPGVSPIAGSGPGQVAPPPPPDPELHCGDGLLLDGSPAPPEPQEWTPLAPRRSGRVRRAP
jgi:hypothetical protein